MSQNQLNESSPSVQTHLGIIQGIIQRMSSNSAFCKGWCITLVSAILVIVADKGKPQYALLAIIPNILFLGLDAYYLALEKMFRDAYSDFVRKLHAGTMTAQDLYSTVPIGSLFKKFFLSLLSFSIWPFYITLLAMILMTQYIII